MRKTAIVDVEGTLGNLYQLLKKDGYICIVELDEEEMEKSKAFK